MKTLKELTLKEKIGQLVMCGIPSTIYDDQAKKIVDEYCVGNIILFSRNFDNANQLKKLDNDLYQHIMDKTGVMPFISIDQEGGQVTRLFKDATFPAGAMTSSASQVPHAAYKNASIIGRDMIRLGLNVNLAPSLDVNNNPKNPSINVRSFSSDPEVVSECGKEYIQGLRENGVLACIKHFPGSGDSNVDSHLALPTIPHDKERLKKIELYPFKENFDSPWLMSTHTMFPAYDTELPATLSKKILTGLLKEELGFKGLIMTDGIEMKAISDIWGVGPGALLAINAGCDMVLVCHELSEQEEVIQTLTEAVHDGRLTIETIDNRVERILKYKNEVWPHVKEYFDIPFEISQENEKMVQDIVDNSLTKLKGIAPTLTKDTFIICPRAKAKTIVEDCFENRNLGYNLKNEFKELDVFEYVKDEETIQKIIEKAKDKKQIICFSYNAVVDPLQVEMINTLITINPDMTVFSMKGPFDYSLYKNLKNYMCLYEYTPHSIQTVINFFKQKIEINGHCPVDNIL